MWVYPKPHAKDGREGLANTILVCMGFAWVVRIATPATTVLRMGV
jgi:hypothetical protein